MNCAHERRLNKTGFGWCRDCGALWENGNMHLPGRIDASPTLRLKGEIRGLMDTFGETGVMRAVADEMDSRLGRALREELNLRRQLNLREAGE